jgi:hypothetical protein
MNMYRFILKSSFLLIAPVAAITLSVDGPALAQTPVANAKKSPLPSKSIDGYHFSPAFLQSAKKEPSRSKVTISARQSADAQLEVTTQFNSESTPSSVKILPVWTFDVKAGRDGDHHPGTMVGHDPFHNPGTDKIPTLVVPLIIRTHTIATAYDSSTGTFSTGAGDTTLDPMQADNTCLAAPNNIPVALVQQSPVFSPAHFVFGGTDVGTTQYIDAFQRANFWNVLGSKADRYHVLLDPVETVEPIVLDVPSNEGLALTDPNLFSAFGFSYCAPMLIVDINWFDSHLVGTLLPKLQEAGVDPSTLPVFLTYNTVWASPVTELYTCCALGYHSITGYPIPTQTYAVVDWDTTGFFSYSVSTLGAEVLSHEVGEWMNDPLVGNEIPPWGNVGQVVGFCSDYLEVGDPLTGTTIPSVTMPNGYPYYLQELAFFSWFEGGQPTGVNGWYSDNGTFKTNAGPACP